MFPSAFTGRAVPSGRCRLHGPSRSDVSPAWAPTLRPVRPCGFFRLASRFLSLRVYQTPPARVIRGRCLSPAYRARNRAVIATWPGVLPPGDAPGISHSLRSVDPTRGWPRLIGMTGPTCRFPVPPAASFIVAGPRAGQCAGHGWRGRGSWASRRSLKSAVPCHPPTPPWLLCTGSFVLTGQDCPGILLSSLRSSASRLRSPLLKTIPPGLLEPPLATSLQR